MLARLADVTLAGVAPGDVALATIATSRERSRERRQGVIVRERSVDGQPDLATRIVL
jgi:hypothetical protein